MSDQATADRLAEALVGACASKNLGALREVNAALEAYSWRDRPALAEFRERVAGELEALSNERDRLARELTRARHADQGVRRYREITDTIAVFTRR